MHARVHALDSLLSLLSHTNSNIGPPAHAALSIKAAAPSQKAAFRERPSEMAAPSGAEPGCTERRPALVHPCYPCASVRRTGTLVHAVHALLLRTRALVPVR